MKRICLYSVDSIHGCISEDSFSSAYGLHKVYPTNLKTNSKVVVLKQNHEKKHMQNLQTEILKILSSIKRNNGKTTRDKKLTCFQSSKHRWVSRAITNKTTAQGLGNKKTFKTPPRNEKLKAG